MPSDYHDLTYAFLHWYLSLKIQTDDIESIEATTADNVNVLVTSTVNWRIVTQKLLLLWQPIPRHSVAQETGADLASFGATC